MRRSRWSRPKTSLAANAGKARKPRIMVGGEFSAGKTQLINGLTGQDVLPSNVTATALPPVWLVGGAAGLAQVDTSGTMHELESLDDVKLDATHFCIMGHSAPILEKLDIIDTPGSSDPNMDAATWRRMLDYADAVRRVLQRVEREAAAFFETFLMVSLLDPADVDGIREHVQDLSGRLEISGAEAPVMDEFMSSHKAAAPAPKPASQGRAMQVIRPRRVTVREKQPETSARSASKVVPISVTAAVTNGDNKAGARTLWNSLLADVDRNDPAAILKAADRLVSILDSESRKNSEGALSGVPSSGDMENRSGSRRRTFAAAAGQSE